MYIFLQCRSVKGNPSFLILVVVQSLFYKSEGSEINCRLTGGPRYGWKKSVKPALSPYFVLGYFKMNVLMFASQCKSQANQFCIDHNVSTAILLIFIKQQGPKFMCCYIFIKNYDYFWFDFQYWMRSKKKLIFPRKAPQWTKMKYCTKTIWMTILELTKLPEYHSKSLEEEEFQLST